MNPINIERELSAGFNARPFRLSAAIIGKPQEAVEGTAQVEIQDANGVFQLLATSTLSLDHAPAIKLALAQDEAVDSTALWQIADALRRFAMFVQELDGPRVMEERFQSTLQHFKGVSS